MAVVNIKGSPDLLLKDAEAVVDKICECLPQKVNLIWGANIYKDMPSDEMEIRCIAGYKKGGHKP